MDLNIKLQFTTSAVVFICKLLHLRKLITYPLSQNCDELFDFNATGKHYLKSIYV